MYCRARYLTPGNDGQTRAERNEKFDEPLPEWDIPPEGEYLFDWFMEIESGLNRFGDGMIYRMTWQDIHAWVETTRTIVYPFEIAILKAMDLAYCEGLDGELQYAHAVAAAEAEKARAAARTPRHR